MKVLIVEDEPLLARQLKKLIETIEPAAQIKGQTNSIETTVDWINASEEPDLIFMDIELADGQCFEIFNQASITSPVIFTTAYDEFALRAFKVNSIDYLLKPIKEDELKAALQKFKSLQKEVAVKQDASIEVLLAELRKTKTLQAFRDRFLVKQGQKLLSVNTDNIAFFCAKNTLNYLVTYNKQKHIIDYTLDEIETFVDPVKFFRANRQFIIAHSAIAAVHPWFNGKLKADVNMLTDEEVIISRDKAPLFKEWLGA